MSPVMTDFNLKIKWTSCARFFFIFLILFSSSLISFFIYVVVACSRGEFMKASNYVCNRLIVAGAESKRETSTK